SSCNLGSEDTPTPPSTSTPTDSPTPIDTPTNTPTPIDTPTDSPINTPTYSPIPTGKITFTINNSNIECGGSYAMTDETITVTMTNTGDDYVVLQGTPIFIQMEIPNTEFIINQASTLQTISAGNSTSFTVTLRPNSTGSKSVKIVIPYGNPSTTLVCGLSLSANILEVTGNKFYTQYGFWDPSEGQSNYLTKFYADITVVGGGGGGGGAYIVYMGPVIYGAGGECGKTEEISNVALNMENTYTVSIGAGGAMGADGHSASQSDPSGKDALPGEDGYSSIFSGELYDGTLQAYTAQAGKGGAEMVSPSETGYGCNTGYLYDGIRYGNGGNGNGSETSLSSGTQGCVLISYKFYKFQ
ncbi:MAG: hypothetical protein JW969_17285, partial [Spirochaetales bacterium]|nr:hypothetical protein [Spirochaetales bacterium]